MPRWQETLIISAGLLRKTYGENIAINASGQVDVAVWPALASGGPRAEYVIIRPVQNLYFAVDVTNNGLGAGPYKTRLFSGDNYAFPLHPNIQTFHFKSVTSTGTVDVNWFIGR